MHTAWVVTGQDVWKKLTKFWGKLFLINFAMGVVTGIVMLLLSLWATAAVWRDRVDGNRVLGYQAWTYWVFRHRISAETKLEC